MRGPEKSPRPTQAPGWPVPVEYENFLQHFPQNKLSEPEKNGSAFFLFPAAFEIWVDSWKR